MYTGILLLFNSSSVNELEDLKKSEQKNEDKNEKDENEEKISKKDENENNDFDNKNDKIEVKNKNKLNKEVKTNGKIAFSSDDNKDISNIITEGVISEPKKLNLQSQHYEGVILMKGVEEYIPEELNEDDVYQLIEDALYGNQNGDENKDLNKITKEQAKAISSILYNKIHHKGNIDMKDYPELEGINVKIGVEKLTREVIKNMMFNNKKIDECQIDLTYANLTKDNDDIKALTIELLP